MQAFQDLCRQVHCGKKCYCISQGLHIDQKILSISNFTNTKYLTKQHLAYVQVLLFRKKESENWHLEVQGDCTPKYLWKQ